MADNEDEGPLGFLPPEVRKALLDKLGIDPRQIVSARVINLPGNNAEAVSARQDTSSDGLALRDEIYALCEKFIADHPPSVGVPSAILATMMVMTFYAYANAHGNRAKVRDETVTESIDGLLDVIENVVERRGLRERFEKYGAPGQAHDTALAHELWADNSPKKDAYFKKKV